MVQIPKISLKRATYFSLFVLGTIWLVSCARHNACTANGNSYLTPYDVGDSTQEEGYNPYQRAFAYYLLSLPPKERASWESSTFTEEEMKAIQNSLDIRLK